MILDFLMNMRKEIVVQMILTLITVLGEKMFSTILDKTIYRPQIWISFGTSDRGTMYVSKTGCYVEKQDERNEKIKKTLNVKINIQAINNASTNNLIGDINLYAYYKGMEVKKLKPIKISVVDGCEKISNCGQNISHSEFILAKTERNIKLWSKLESITDSDNNDNKTDIKYDEIRLGYYNMRGKKRKLHLLNIDEDSCWESGDKETPEEPIRIL